MSDSDRKDKKTAEELRLAAEAEALASAATVPPRRPTGIDQLADAATLPPTKRSDADQLANATTLPLTKRPGAKPLARADTSPAEAPEDEGAADTHPGIKTRDITSTHIPPRRTTYPPMTWDKADAVISSASPKDALGDGRGGTDMVATDHVDERLSEKRAREILNARFKAAGIVLQQDFAYRQADLIVTLDGYDELQCVGYAYISHADADVVTDFDEAAELAFEQLASEGKAFVLVIHDTDVPTPDTLERRIDTFFIALRARSEDTQTF